MVPKQKWLLPYVGLLFVDGRFTSGFSGGLRKEIAHALELTKESQESESAVTSHAFLR